MNDATESKTGEELKFPPSQFSLVYESKDGRLCMFEDKDGHLTVVRAEKLA